MICVVNLNINFVYQTMLLLAQRIKKKAKWMSSPRGIHTERERKKIRMNEKFINQVEMKLFFIMQSGNLD